MDKVEQRARELLAEGYAADGWKNASELANSIPAETPTMRAIIAALSLSDERDPMSVYEAYANGVNAGMGGLIPADTETLLAEAVEVGTLCNLAAEDTLDAGMTATADALSKAALTITNLGRAVAALSQQPEARVYQCPRCATSMEVDPTAKPEARGVMDEAWMQTARELYDRCRLWPESTDDGFMALLELRNHVQSILAALTGERNG